MTDMRMLLCIAQPPCKQKRRPLEKDYYKLAIYSIKTLIRTGFPAEKIICITSTEKHSKKLTHKLGIDGRFCSAKIPKNFTKWIKKSDQHLYFYKPPLHC